MAMIGVQTGVLTSLYGIDGAYRAIKEAGFQAVDANLDELKAHYTKGGLGDVKVKKFLNAVLEEELSPIRERRKIFAEDRAAVMEMLKDGTEKARAKAASTLTEVKRAMGIDYFSAAQI